MMILEPFGLLDNQAGFANLWIVVHQVLDTKT